jgi:dolichyl-phosphate-mannose-protein mannosyltransferase
MLFHSRIVRAVTLILLFGLALSIRLYDLTDLPLDFHPTRQLLSAIKARALYYRTHPDGISAQQLAAGIALAKLKAGVEPVVFERLVAYTYRFTGEQVWVARIYSSLFWLIGGVFLFLLVRDLVSFDGAIFSTAYYLFFPYVVIASRSFQPDPLMVMLLLAFWWMFARWLNPSPHGRGAGVRADVREALLAGLLGGFAIFIKFSAAFFVIGAALGLALTRFNVRELLKNGQIWAMALVGATPSLFYLYHGIRYGGLGGQFAGRFFPSLLLNPLNYVQWLTEVNLAAGGLFIMLALLSFLLVKDRSLKGLMIGLWSAYILYGLFFNYHTATHDYYHLPFISIVALSLGPLAGWAAAQWTETTSGYGRGLVYVILLYGLFSGIWEVRNQLKAVDYRPEAQMWAEIGAKLDYAPTAMGLIPDYGSRLEYYGFTSAGIWPTLDDLNYTELRSGDAFVIRFRRLVRNKIYFLVTDFEELKRQPKLSAHLVKYPVYAQGDGYIIYQLREKK